MSIGNLFNEEWYLKNYPDVRAAVEAGLMDARTHFDQYGRFEGRSPDPLFNPADYLAANPDVRAAVEAGVMTAYDHFMQFGATEGRSPTKLFDPDFYLSQNPDVRAAVEAGLISATEHFLLYGQGEPRQINPFINLGDYLNANADLKQAAEAGLLSPLTHLLIHGAAEERDLGNGINLGIFADDPAYKAAIQTGDFTAAMERVGEVAPFLPTFEPPAGWEPAPNTPIPTDFTPPEGTKLVIPPSVKVPDDMDLPDTFEPVEPVEPGPGPDPDPGNGDDDEDEEVREFGVTIDGDGSVTFHGNATGPISLSTIDTGENLTFSRDGLPVVFEDKDLSAIQRIVLDNTSEFFFSKLNLSFPQFDGEASGGRPRVTVEFDEEVKSASINLIDIEEKAAIGIAGKNLETLRVVSGFTGEADEGWHQLQLWDGAPSGKTDLPGLKTVELATISPTDLGAYAPYGLLTNPTKIDGSDSTGALKITPAGAPFILGWTDIRTGSGKDILKFSPGQLKDGTTIHAGGDDDTIYTLVGTHVTGGEGDDTFVIQADASLGSDTYINIVDYGDGDDIVDLTMVANLHMLGQLDIRQGGVSKDGWTIPGEKSDTVVQLSGASGVQLILEDTYGDTIEFKVGAGLTDIMAIKTTWTLEGDYGSVLVNVQEGATIDGGDAGQILVGGGGAQTLIGGAGNDILVGGKGNDIFVLDSGYGAEDRAGEMDVIADFSIGDRIQVDALFSGSETLSTEASGNMNEANEVGKWWFADNKVNIVVATDDAGIQYVSVALHDAGSITLVGIVEEGGSYIEIGP